LTWFRHLLCLKFNLYFLISGGCRILGLKRVDTIDEQPKTDEKKVKKVKPTEKKEKPDFNSYFFASGVSFFNKKVNE
jgi:hypothetical protein